MFVWVKEVVKCSGILCLKIRELSDFDAASNEMHQIKFIFESWVQIEILLKCFNTHWAHKPSILLNSSSYAKAFTYNICHTSTFHGFNKNWKTFKQYRNTFATTVERAQCQENPYKCIISLSKSWLMLFLNVSVKYSNN